MSADLRKKTLIIGILDIITWVIVMGACAFLCFGAYAIFNPGELDNIAEAIAGVFAIIIIGAMFIAFAVIFAIVSLFVLASGIVNLRNATTKKDDIIINGYNMFIAVLSFIYFVGLVIGFFISISDLAQKGANLATILTLVFCLVLAGLFMAGGILKVKLFKQVKAEKAKLAEQPVDDAELEIVSVGEVATEEKEEE